MCLNFDNYMFGSNNKDKFFSERKDSERSLISETVSIDGTVNSSGAIDIAGLIKGPVFSKEIVIKETGSISGEVEADNVEIHGHLDGKISAQNVVIGSTGVVKGDIEFANNLKTEEGADIDGYIKRTNNGKNNSEEDIAIESIVEREVEKKPRIVHSVHKEAV